jgi:hypothetical protein
MGLWGRVDARGSNTAGSSLPVCPLGAVEQFIARGVRLSGCLQ